MMKGEQHDPPAPSPMRATARDDRAGGWCTGLGADSASVHDLTTGNGDVDWEFLKPCWRKGEGIITEHDEVGEFPHLNVVPRTFSWKPVYAALIVWLRRASDMVSASPAVIFWPLSVWCATAVPRSRSGSTG